MLPKSKLPTYELTLPSDGRKVKVRPFLVGEEKLLLMALESAEENDIINTTKQIINNCLIESDVDVDELPFFDIDYLFIALRAKSVGESIDIKFTCNNTVVDEEGKPSLCGATFPAKIDITNCKVLKDDTIKKEIDLGGDIIVVMKYPDYATMKRINDGGTQLDKMIAVIAGSIEMICEGEKIYSNKDVSTQEIVEFVEGLTQNQFKKLEAFVDSFPSFVITSEATCEKCGFVHRLEYTDFTSFFV
jgi:hypothetical protein